MFIRIYKALPELSHLVSRIVVNSFDLNNDQTSPFPPQPDQCLYFYPRDRVKCRFYEREDQITLPASIVIGPQLSRVDLTMGRNMLVIMVCFQPGGLYRLLKIPMNEMIGQPFESKYLLGNEADEVTERLHECREPAEMVNIVQVFLLKKLRKLREQLPFERVLSEMIAHRNYFSVDKLAKESCVSIRQLERQFNTRTGMPPKLFAKLVRFSRAWVIREKHPDWSWLHIAHLCDYADQMHMIRDFKQFAGVTPRLLEKDLEKTSLRIQGISFD